MSEVFLEILNMSISAGWVVLAVILLRLIVGRVSKRLTALLWGIVGLRLVCPFTLESVMSLIPSGETVSPEIMTDPSPEIHTGVPIINNTLNPVISETLTPVPEASANPLQILIPILAAVWLFGIALMLIYAAVSYIRVGRRVATAVKTEGNIYESEHIATPFLLGIFRPRIYIPLGIGEESAAHVIAHERAHLSRGDHIWKPIGFLLLSVHWFNPLVWVGYLLFCRDIELACDERVISGLDREGRADYSEALLALGVGRGSVSACPLAFGEVGVKGRIRSVLSYKKPAFWVVIICIVLCAVLAVCFLTDPLGHKDGGIDPESFSDIQNGMKEKFPEYFGLNYSDGLDIIVWQFAEGHYSFGLLPHSRVPYGINSDKLTSLKGASVFEMRMIIKSYALGEEDFTVVPWHNPLSSYSGAEMAEPSYSDRIRSMLFGKGQENAELVYDAPIYSFVIGRDEIPRVRIYGDILFDEDTGELLGRVSEVALVEENFSFPSYADFMYGGVDESIREGYVTAYEIDPTDKTGVGLYYLIKMESGHRLLVYGHYTESGEREGTIRWIFDIDA